MNLLRLTDDGKTDPGETGSIDSFRKKARSPPGALLEWIDPDRVRYPSAISFGKNGARARGAFS
jgi:hypothetical protein